jgi:hypothetical protein
VLLGWLLGCVPTVISEQWQVQLQAADVSTLGWLDQPADMVAGTTTCFQLGWAPGAIAPSPNPRGCFVHALQGQVELVQGCLVFLDEGQAELRFEPFCDGLLSDRIRFEILHPEEVRARPLELELVVEQALAVGAPGLPPRQPEGEPWRVVETGWFRFFPRLYNPDTDLDVGFELDELTVATEPESLLVESGEAYGTLLLADGLEGSVRAIYQDEDERHSGEYPLADVVGVAEDEVVSLEVFPVYLPEGYLREPIGARAVARDADGNLLWGAPVRWSLDEGDLAYGTLDQLLPGPDYVLLDDDCLPPEQGGARRAVLRASLGAHTATATLRWRTPVLPPDPGWVPNVYCEQGEPYVPPEPTEPTEPTAPEEPPPEKEPSWRRARWSGGCAVAPQGGWTLLLASVWSLRRAGGARGGAHPAGRSIPPCSR